MDEAEYYQSFLLALQRGEALPSDDEDFFAGEDQTEDFFYPRRVPKNEVLDLLLENQERTTKRQTVYRPVLPVFPQVPLKDIFVFTKEQRLLLFDQLEQFVQLLLQTFLLASPELRHEPARLLKRLIERTEFDNPEFDISYLVHPAQWKVKSKRQLIVYQVPLLEIARHILAVKDAGKYRFSRKEIVEVLSTFAPAFIHPALLPLESPQAKRVRTGFNILDDMLLLQGLYVSKSPVWLKEHWLHHKTPAQIRNRIKNLKSKKYKAKNEAQHRLISLLERQSKHFSEEEQEIFRRGLTWFGFKRLQLVKKYFLPHRSLKQLQEFYEKTLATTPEGFQAESLCEEACECFCNCSEVYEAYVLN
mmetsp:Transcript_6708/g.11904  ORF Transcript_6708/g.11904 Transcript_6708/m.11904 type:complete len:361 (-) Transcript_6708:2142-3224(-)|eukprot:CAMPEP_0204896324 /NCGR_PEP_ID=MMETSP1397-20131031/97_1 /ASSEMBLY_ACC=CAM_ASM_000891 /TAXON_ID=49980 /ORGANISM="Climacostomum Climacostomum virens, Strain Stock W-24" /LENGTH=360 /DNA_ID=CAMNT_0052063917 /DNA_START=29 /DNA_END=1111 /DNA_ORIENTATION=-